MNNKFIDCKEFSTSLNDTAIVQWPESNTLNQLWQFVPVNPAANIFLIVSIRTGKALTVISSSNIQQWSYETDNSNQLFQIQQENNGNDQCRIVSMQTNTSIAVDSNTNGRSIQVGKQQQQSAGDFIWKLIETSNTNLYFKNRI